MTNSPSTKPMSAPISGLDLLMILIHRADLTTTGVSLWVYCFQLAVFGLVGLLMHWLQRASA